jgi:hypothetical protein
MYDNIVAENTQSKQLLHLTPFFGFNTYSPNQYFRALNCTSNWWAQVTISYTIIIIHFLENGPCDFKYGPEYCSIYHFKNGPRNGTKHRHYAHTKYHGMPFSIITLPTFQSYCIIVSYNLHSEISDSTLSYRIRKYRQKLVTYL